MNRIKVLDIMRGIAIILVIIGISKWHYPNSFIDANVIISTIYKFHMPLFVFISGVLVYERIASPEKWIGKKALYLLIPWVVFNAIHYYWSYTPMYVGLGQPHNDTFFAWMMNVTLFNNGMWFLWTLFSLFALMLLVNWVDKNCNNRKFLLFAVALTVGVLLLPTGGNYFILRTFPQFFPFMMMGYFAMKYKDNWKLLVPSVLIMGAIGFSAYPWALLGIASVYAIAKGMERIRPLSNILCYVGTLTLGIFVFVELFNGYFVGERWIAMISSIIISGGLAYLLTIGSKRFDLTNAIFLGNVEAMKRLANRLKVMKLVVAEAK